jgi:hypothetical protein
MAFASLSGMDSVRKDFRQLDQLAREENFRPIRPLKTFASQRDGSNEGSRLN